MIALISGRGAARLDIQPGSRCLNRALPERHVHGLYKDYCWAPFSLVFKDANNSLINYMQVKKRFLTFTRYDRWLIQAGL